MHAAHDGGDMLQHPSRARGRGNGPAAVAAVERPYGVHGCTKRPIGMRTRVGELT